MLENISIHKILFLDVETVPVAPTFSELSEEFQLLWAEKTRWQRSEGQTPDECYGLQAGVMAEFAKVIALEGGPVGLVPASQWECLNRGCAEDSFEIIWSIQNGPLSEGSGDFIPMGIPTQSGYNGWSGHKFTQNMIDAFPMANGLPITDPASGYDPADPYSNRDPRLRMTFFFEGDPYDGGTIGDAEFGGVCCNGDTRLMANIGIAPVFPKKRL